MSEFSVPNRIPNYLTDPEINVFKDGSLEKKYADGMIVWIGFGDDGAEIETRFPDGSLYFDEGDENHPGPTYIQDGHEDPEPRNN